jgi:hypothetical protein
MSEVKVSSAYPATIIPIESTTPVTPHHQIRPSYGVSVLSMSDRSHSDVRRKLEQRLAETTAKMYKIGRLGESLVKQEQELNDRIKEIDSHPADDEIKPELRSKLADLENGFKEIERESAKAFAKTVPFLGKVRVPSIFRFQCILLGKYGNTAHSWRFSYKIRICRARYCFTFKR